MDDVNANDELWGPRALIGAASLLEEAGGAVTAALVVARAFTAQHAMKMGWSQH